MSTWYFTIGVPTAGAALNADGPRAELSDARAARETVHDQ